MNPWVTRTYFAFPAWMQSLWVSAYGMRLRWLRYGRTQRQTLEDLRRSQWIAPDEMRAQQLARLSAVVRHARGSVPFYRTRGLPAVDFRSLDELQEIAPVTKEDVQAAGTAVISDRYRGRRLVEIHTGGTTGKPLTIWCDRAALQRNYAFFDRFRESSGVEAGSRVATFAGRTLVRPDQTRPPYWRHNFAGNALLLSSYHIAPSSVDAYVNALVDFHPQLIDSYPSSIEPIARRALERRAAVRPRAVITSSETLLPETRALIERAFECRVFDHYGAAEMVALITQCEHGTYHVNPEFGVVEILVDGWPARPGELGEIVATGFVNPVMPLIRYRTGDLAVQGEGTCRCRRPFPIVQRIEGRQDDVIVCPDGRRVGRLDPIFKAVSSIHETRIVQDAADHLTVEIVTLAPLAESESSSLLWELANRVGPTMRVDLVRVPQISRTGAGKLRAVVNLSRGSAA